MIEPGAPPEPAVESAAGASTPLLYDQVTDLPRLPLLMGRMSHLLAERGELGLLTIQIVQERPVETPFGWQAFDALLRHVARFLEAFRRDHLRREDDLAETMVNGNAFVITLSPPRDRTRLEPADLQRIKARIREPLRASLVEALPAGAIDRFGCYLGCAQVLHEPGVRAERLIYQALDEATADALRARSQQATEQGTALRTILAERSVSAVYQPVVDLSDRRVVGYEALSRVSTRLFRGPEQMFRAAQAANVIWALERVCRERALGMLGPFPPGLALFLNVEPDSIYDPHFRGSATLELLSQAGVQPRQVVLEVTEHSGVQDFKAFRRALEQFRSQGFRLAIDDVGSAYSGLQSIAEIAPDFIKIDMSLTRDLHQNPIKRDLMHTISKFSVMTGIALIAEGVESVEEMQELRRIGVRLAQGYLFARPEHPRPDARLDLLRDACPPSGRGQAER
jgi:EAL domain-containing protein (putative c-di-GMP-specific phosphodiesterase class I)/GGDEF domain-containing protein